MTTLTSRLNQILPRIVSDEFLSGSGIGNEIAFYVFDYPPEDELRVRDHVTFLLDQMPKKRAGMKVRHVNLFDFVLGYLRSRKLPDKALQMQKEKGKGDAALLKALAGMLHESKIAAHFAESSGPASMTSSSCPGRQRVAAVAVSHPPEQPPPGDGQDPWCCSTPAGTTGSRFACSGR
ncbi:Uncharacterized protein OS=delta proteobacterium NaphS2 GN=NPH_1847 PE=4 SV=1: DUF1788 [Gemmata massiliana]|uniref:Uncharacterized protein n=1 Tax=Gemmata massiliana TaxID=1210884 RepID=A0A6P2D4A5_9BACT|nr:hypothetical protein [Gemmata massiliana]VTR96131.1 Uncharacterized protein OS=delta proteobacterium NaphS2 GN=NPH_1847 PE=4 SV=1: DUF1788 [Gemmata massiliana]